MKKLLVVLLLFGFLTSCGPRRMKCGVGRRCLVESASKDNFEKVEIQKA